MKTVKEQAIEVIKAGGSVKVGNIMYTMKNLGDLPGEEFFVEGDAVAEAETLDILKAQKADIEARIARMEAKTKTKAKVEAETVVEEPTEVKKEVKKN